MRKSIGYCLIISITTIFFSYGIGFAADALYRLMHNDHDALVVGKILTLAENKITIRVDKQIISSRDLNLASPKKQIPVKGIIVVKGIKEYALFHGTDAIEGRPKTGDYVLASLQKEGRSFKNAWGVFKTDSNNYKTLNILYPEGSSSYTRMDATAIKAFVNSDGKLNNPSFNGDKEEVYLDAQASYDRPLQTLVAIVTILSAIFIGMYMLNSRKMKK